MRFTDLIAARQSVRQYLDRPVERGLVRECLEAARLAPSASNAQPWRFVVVDEPELRREVARETFGRLVSFNHFSLQAPVLVVVVAEGGKVGTRLGDAVRGRPYSLIDIGIAAEHFCLRAAELGLGTCMLGWFDEKGVKRRLGVPAGRRVDLVITLGWPADGTVRPKKRKALQEVACWNRYERGGGE